MLHALSMCNALYLGIAQDVREETLAVNHHGVQEGRLHEE